MQLIWVSRLGGSGWMLNDAKMIRPTLCVSNLECMELWWSNFGNTWWIVETLYGICSIWRRSTVLVVSKQVTGLMTRMSLDTTSRVWSCHTLNDGIDQLLREADQISEEEQALEKFLEDIRFEFPLQHWTFTLAVLVSYLSNPITCCF